MLDLYIISAVQYDLQVIAVIRKPTHSVKLFIWKTSSHHSTVKIQQTFKATITLFLLLADAIK